MFANKINRQTTITLERVEQQKLNDLLYVCLMHASDT